MQTERKRVTMSQSLSWPWLVQLSLVVTFALNSASVEGTPAAYLSGSIVKCYNEGEEVVVPFIHDDPCYRCKCLSTEIVCLDTCGHKKCNFNGKVYKHNDSWNNGTCTKCTCNNGKSSCREETCPQVTCGAREKLTTLPGECCTSCVHSSAQCTLNGQARGGHVRSVKTFDGARYPFDGKCNYVLARDCHGKAFTIHLVQDPEDSSIPRRTARQKTLASSWPASSRLSFTGQRADGPGNKSHRSRRDHSLPTSPSSLAPGWAPASPASHSLTVTTINSTRRRERGLFDPWHTKSSPSSPSSHSHSSTSTTLFTRSNIASALSQSGSNSTRKSTKLATGEAISVSIVFKIGTTKVRLTPTDGPDHWKIRVGRKNSTLPFIQFGTMTIVKDPLSLSSSGRPSILVWTNMGIKVTWDGEDDLAITMPAKVKSSVCGLCGNYNGNRADDLLAKRGGAVKSISHLVHSWRVGTNGFCPDKEARRVASRRGKVSSLPLLDS